MLTGCQWPTNGMTLGFSKELLAHLFVFQERVSQSKKDSKNLPAFGSR